MLRLLADENLNKYLLDRLYAAIPDLDVIRVQETEVYQAPDPIILKWAANENRILLTHDINTMPGFAFARVRSGQPISDVIEVALFVPLSSIVEDLVLMLGAGTSKKFTNQVRYIPIR